MAEASKSEWVGYVTLTYRDSPQRVVDRAHRSLWNRHAQRFVRAIRKRGHEVRYLIAGEYGSRRGRAHWHCLLFGMGRRPSWLKSQRFAQIAEWSHGHVDVKTVLTESRVRYVVKYLLKQVEPEVSSGLKAWSEIEKSLLLSKKPPLGDAYFAALAEYHAALGVLPHRFQYLPPGVADSGRRFTMTGATRRNYLDRFCTASGRDAWSFKGQVEEWTWASLVKVARWRGEVPAAGEDMSELVRRARVAQKELALVRKAQAETDRADWFAAREREYQEAKRLDSLLNPVPAVPSAEYRAIRARLFERKDQWPDEGTMIAENPPMSPQDVPSSVTVALEARLRALRRKRGHGLKRSRGV